jgi:hypothetical protein
VASGLIIVNVLFFIDVIFFVRKDNPFELKGIAQDKDKPERCRTTIKTGIWKL